MIRTLVLAPLVVLLAGAGGVAACRWAGVGVDLRAALAAAATSLVVCELASAPVMLARRSAQAIVAQAGLVGTVIHLFGHVVVAAVVILGKLPLGQSFIYWLMAFYWVTLIAMAAAFAVAVRQAPVNAGKV